VTLYLLIDTKESLQRYLHDLAAVPKVNFNRVIFSFVKPSLTDYVAGSLANTGILGYFYNGDGKGVDAFQMLVKAIQLSKEKNIQTFLSVGGWNYSCNYSIYGSKCGDPPSDSKGIYYDSFPDPTISSEVSKSQKAYSNVVKLASDLGVDGIDVDAEEFWHADKNAVVGKEILGPLQLQIILSRMVVQLTKTS